MDGLTITQVDLATNDTHTWQASSPSDFVAKVCTRAMRGLRAPFAIARHWPDAEAEAAGIANHAGATGAIVQFDDDTMRFVAAPAGAIVLPGAGHVTDDTTPARVAACVSWLEYHHQAHVDVQGLDGATTATDLDAGDPAVAAWYVAEHAQAHALAVAVLEALAVATDARAAAERQLPSIAQLVHDAIQGSAVAPVRGGA